VGTTEAPPAALARVAAVAAACGLPTPRVQVRTGVRPATVDVRRRVPVLQLGERLLTAADDVFDHVVGHELGHVATGRRSHPLSYAGRTVLVVFPATSLAGVWWLGVYGVNVAVIVFAGGLCLATAVMTPRLRRSELTCDVYAAHRGYPMTPTAYAWLSEQAPHLPLPLVTPPVVQPTPPGPSATTRPKPPHRPEPPRPPEPPGFSGPDPAPAAPAALRRSAAVPRRRLGAGHGPAGLAEPPHQRGASTRPLRDR